MSDIDIAFANIVHQQLEEALDEREPGKRNLRALRRAMQLASDYSSLVSQVLQTDCPSYDQLKMIVQAHLVAAMLARDYHCEVALAWQDLMEALELGADTEFITTRLDQLTDDQD